MSRHYGRYVAVLGGLGALVILGMAVSLVWRWSSPGPPPIAGEQSWQAPDEKQHAAQIGCAPAQLAALPVAKQADERRRCAEDRDQREISKGGIAESARGADASERETLISYATAKSAFVQAIATVFALIAAVAAAIAAGWAVFYARAAWKTAERTLCETSRSSERQLRAYVHISKATFRDNREGMWVELTIHNFGQTPAHDLWVEQAASVRDFPLTQSLAQLVRADSLFDLAPNAEAGKITFPFAEWDDPSPARFNSGGTALYIHGTIHYRDAFGKDRETHFRHYMRSRSDNAIAPADEGNTST